MMANKVRLIHCTQKLLKELGVPTTEPARAPAVSEGLGNWYANLLRIERRKCILFTNEKTIYTFLIPAVLKKDLMNIKGLFLSHLSYNLQYEGFGPEVIDRIRQEYQEIGFAKTVSRRVLGFMNDLAHNYDFFIRRPGDWSTCRL